MVKIGRTILKDASQFYNHMKIEGKLFVVTEEMKQLMAGICNKGVFQQLIDLEHVSYTKKKAVLFDCIHSLSDDSKNYITPYLSEAGLPHLVEAVEAFLDIYESSKVEIVTAIPLTDEQTERIAEAFQRKTKRDYDSWINTVDPMVIGGVLIKTKEHMLDGTVAKKLKTFKQTACHM